MLALFCYILTSGGYFNSIIGLLNVAARKSVRWVIRRLTHPIFSMLLTHTASGPPVDGVARALLWVLCKQYGFERSDKWYEHIPKK